MAVTPLQQVLDGRQNLAQFCHAVVMLGDEQMQGVHAVVMLGEPVVMLGDEQMQGVHAVVMLGEPVIMLGDELIQDVHAVVMLGEPVVMLRHQLIEGGLGSDKRVLGALQRVHTFGMVIKMLAIAAHGAVMQELGTLQQRQAVEVV